LPPTGILLDSANLVLHSDTSQQTIRTRNTGRRKSLRSNTLGLYTVRSPFFVQNMLYCPMRRLFVLFFTSVLSANSQGLAK